MPAVLGGQAQGVRARLQVGGDDEGDARGVVDDPEVLRDGCLGAVGIDEDEAHGGVVAQQLDVPSREGEGASGGGAGVFGAGGCVLHAADGDGCFLTADDVDGGVLDGLAQVGAHVEVHHDAVLLGVPLTAADNAAHAHAGVVESGVDIVAGHEEAFDDALLQLEHV